MSIGLKAVKDKYESSVIGENGEIFDIFIKSHGLYIDYIEYDPKCKLNKNYWKDDYEKKIFGLYEGHSYFLMPYYKFGKKEINKPLMEKLLQGAMEAKGQLALHYEYEEDIL